MSIDFGDLGLDDLIEETKSTVVQQDAVPSGRQRQMGGFENMSDEDIEKFQNSAEYKEYGAKIHEASDIKANYFGKTVQEILGLSQKREGIGYSHNAVECYPIDLEDFEDILNDSPPMQLVLNRGEKLLPTFKYLYQDLWLSLYKNHVHIVPETDIHISARLNRNLLKILVNTPEYIQLRKSCRFDRFNAAWAAEILGEEAIKILEDALQQIKDLEAKKQAMDELLEEEMKMDELVEELDEIEELLEEARRHGNWQAVQHYEEMLQQRAAGMTGLKEMANQIAETCDELVEEDEDQDELAEAMATQMGTPFTQASQQVQEIDKIAQAWGLGTGADTRIAYGPKKDAIEKIRRSPKLKNFTDLIGRFKESAITEQKKKAKHGAVEIKSVTTGDKIQDTLPSERMNLAMDATRPDFYRRMTEHSLMQYSKEAHKAKNKGPIIVCVDCSGSMNGDQETWSKALAVGILEVAQLQKRDYACILYSGSAKAPIIIGKDEIAPDKVIRVAEEFDGGGTSFEAPLRKAMELINQSQFKEAK